MADRVQRLIYQIVVEGDDDAAKRLDALDKRAVQCYMTNNLIRNSDGSG